MSTAKFAGRGGVMTRIAPHAGQNIRGIVEFDSAPDPHIASAQAMCPSKPSDSAMAR